MEDENELEEDEKEEGVDGGDGEKYGLIGGE